MAKKKRSTTRKKAAKLSTPKAAAEDKTQGSCFVMMPFNEPFGGYYDSIFRPAIRKAMLDPILASDLFRPSAIVSDLWKMIQTAKVLLAELTTKNANVFYELGLAHAIGKPVVLICETMDDVPFDLQQLRILEYDKNDPKWGEKLSDGITNAITETLASPIESVPPAFRKTVASQAPKQDAIEARFSSLESQVHQLQSTVYRGHGVTVDVLNMHQELKQIRSNDQLEKWGKRWHSRGITQDMLQRALEGSGLHISSKLIFPNEGDR